MKNIVILGAGDLGKEIVWLIEDINRRMPTYLILGFLDDDTDKLGKEFYGYRVLGDISRLEELNESVPVYAVLAFQDGALRRKVVEEHPGFQHWESIVHPSAVIASSSPVNRGCVLFPQVTVSVDTVLGSFGLYYIHSTVCNDCKIGDYVSLMCGASILEHANVGDECFLGAGSCVHPHKSIGNRVQVEVEATVAEDYQDDALVMEKR